VLEGGAANVGAQRVAVEEDDGFHIRMKIKDEG
jgi:hypothetical protein